MTVAYGLFSLALVLGWSALFLRGPGWGAIVVQSLWLALICALAILSPDPAIAAAGAITGALAHLWLQTGLKGRRA